MVVVASYACRLPPGCSAALRGSEDDLFPIPRIAAPEHKDHCVTDSAESS